MKRHFIIALALAAALSVQCRQAGPAPRPTIPLVLSVAADTTGAGHVAAHAGAAGAAGHIALLGESKPTLRLAGMFLTADRVDNIDGRPVRDSLPDFAGETFDVMLDHPHEPYARYFRSGARPDSLREVAVRGALCAWDSLSRAKILILTSPLHAGYGYFDIDTLQQLKGGRCHVLTPVHESLRAALDGGARHIAVCTEDTVRRSGVWEGVLRELSPETRLTVLSPRPQQDSCSALESFARQYRPLASSVDALVMDSSALPADSLRAYLQADTCTLTALLPSRLRLLDPDDCLVQACCSLLRRENLFSHRIQLPAANYYSLPETPAP